MKTKKYAAIDVGSNAMRLLINNVIEIDGEKLYKKADIIRIPIRLGTEAFLDGKISDQTIQKFLSAMNAYAHLMIAHGVVKYRACATSALREASNGAEIIAMVKQETEIDLEIINGQEEAQIIYATHIERLMNNQGAFLYVDVGGGSVEITLFENGKTLESESFNVGTIRLLNDLVSDEVQDDLKYWIQEITKGKKVYLIGSGGNINKVFKLSRRPKNEALSLHYLENYLEGLQNHTYEERVTKLDLNLDRADVIIPALKIFTAMMRWSNADKIYVPKIGLADGIIKMMD